MEYLVMECGLSYAVVMDQDGRVLKVPNLSYTVGQTLEDVVLLPERLAKPALHKRLARWGTMAACLCLLLLGSWIWQSPIGTVRIQINPDVQMSVNRFNRVVAVEGLNEDGAALIDGYRAYGKEMKTVSDELADRAMELGYLADGGQITLTVDSEKNGWKTAAEEMLLLELEIHFERRITVTVDGRQPSAGQEPQEEIVITPAQPDGDSDEDDSDDDAEAGTENGYYEDDDGIDDNDDLDAAVSAMGDADDQDEQDDTTSVSEGGGSDDDDTHGGNDDEDPEQPDDNADDSDSDDDNENEDD